MTNIDNKKDILREGKEMGVDKYEILLDPWACPDCLNLYASGRKGKTKKKGKQTTYYPPKSNVFTVEELRKLKGPPLHKGCRCEIQSHTDYSNIDALADKIVAQAEAMNVKNEKYLKNSIASKKIAAKLHKGIKTFSGIVEKTKKMIKFFKNLV